MKTLHLNCLLFIYTMMQASKANESVSEYSKTWLCIKVKNVADVVPRKHKKSHFNVTGVQLFSLQILTEVSLGLDLQKSTTKQI